MERRISPPRFLVVISPILLAAALLTALVGPPATQARPSPYQDTGTETPSASPSPSLTDVTATLTSTVTLTTTVTLTPTDTPTIGATTSITSTATVTPTETMTATATLTATLTLTPTVTATATATPTFSATRTVSPTAPGYDVFLPRAGLVELAGAGNTVPWVGEVVNLATCGGCLAHVSETQYRPTGEVYQTVTYDIPPGGLRERWGWPAETIAVHLRSNQPLSAVVRGYQTQSAAVYSASAYTGLTRGATYLLLPALSATSNSDGPSPSDPNSSLALQNTTDVAAQVTVQLTAHRVNGAPVGRADSAPISLTIPPHGTTKLDASVGLPTSGDYPRRFYGYAVITSTVPLAAVGFDVAVEARRQTRLPVITDDWLSRELFAPRILARFDETYTRLGLHNPADTPTDVVLVYTPDEASRGLTGEVASGQQVTVTLQLAPHETQFRSAADLEAFSRFSGTARLSAGAPIGAWVVQEEAGGARGDTYPVPPVASLTPGVRLPLIWANFFDLYTDWTCGNPSPTQPTRLRVRYVADALISDPVRGERILDLVIPPGGSLTRSERERNSLDADLNLDGLFRRFRGTAFITSLDGLPLACVVRVGATQEAPSGDSLALYLGVNTAPYTLPGPSPTPTPTVTLTPTLTPTPDPRPWHLHLPYLVRGVGGKPGGTWRCWPDNSSPACGGPTPTATPAPPTPTLEPPTLEPPTPLPQPTRLTMRRLYGVDMLSATDGWAVGADGYILHWDGHAWTLRPESVPYPAPGAPPPSVASERLSDVFMLSATDGWIVGFQGTILHWNGQAWSRVASPTNSSLFSVALVSATDGWAVGFDAADGNGVILRWDGSQWRQVTSPTTGPLTALSVVSATDVWAVGLGGTILHWDGSTWSRVNSPTALQLNDIHMLNASLGWAVGEGGTVLRWEGGVWQRGPSATGDLRAIKMLSSADGWIISSTGALHGDGVVWEHFAAGPVEPWALDFVTATDGWIVGGVIFHWDGQVWTDTTVLPLPTAAPTLTATLTPTPTITPTPTATLIARRARLNDILMLSATDGWAVGDGGAIQHWDGQAWRYVPSPTHYDLRALSATSPTSVWAAGDGGAILHWDGRAWALMDTPTWNGLTNISMASETAGWAVGGGAWYWDGQTWAAVVYERRGEWQGFTDVVALSPTAAWAFGHWSSRECIFGNCYDYGGDIFWRWDSGTNVWRIAGDRRLRSLDTLSTGEVWGSQEGTISRWDGQTWTDYPVGMNVQGLDMLSSVEGWAVGNGGGIRYWNGREWRTVPSPVSATLLAVSMVSPTEGWAIGRDEFDQGFLLRYTTP